MKLVACHIENFGKLSDLSLQFSDGLNVIKEANAWGKSTLAAFLKAMFYGLDAKKDAKAFEKERVMYRPWQGGAFGGEVDFMLDGNMYRISRSFGRTEKEDEFHLYDLRTQLECFDYSEAIGNEIFELDSASFKRSIYIAQNDCGSEASDGINAKLGNLAENTDDINNFESANKQLKDILNQLTPDRVTGSIKKRKNYITQLTQELGMFESAQTGLEGIQRKAQIVSLQMQELREIRKGYADALVEAGEDSKRKALYAQYEELCLEVDKKEKTRDAYKEVFAAGMPSAVEFQVQMQNVSKLNEAAATARGFELTLDEMEDLNKLEIMFEKSIPTDDEIDKALEMFAEIDKQKQEIMRQESKAAMYQQELEDVPEEPEFFGASVYRGFLYVGVGIALVGLGAFAAWYFNLIHSIEPQLLLIAAGAIGACGVVITFIGAVLGLFVSRSRQRWEDKVFEDKSAKMDVVNNMNDTVLAMKEDVRGVLGTIGEFLGKFHVYCEVGEYQQRLYALKGQAQEYLRLKEKRDTCNREKVVSHELQNKIVDFAQLYEFQLGEDYAADLNLLQTKVAEYQMAEAAYQEALTKKDAFVSEQDPTLWEKKALCPYSIEELSNMIAETDEKLEECKVAKQQYAKQMEDLQEQLDMRDEKESELREMYLEQEKDMAKYNLLKVTQSFLQIAKERFTARYMDPIAKGFSKYYGMLTGDTGENWVIDANINLKVREYGELRETHWLSAGYKDLIGVCMRLALVDAMYPDEKPFLILDDPFVNLDKEKMEAGNELLKDVAKEYQVIYFTCHDSRSPL